jgi:hypothetical protein
MIIQITPDGYILLSGDTPEVGRKYSLEDADDPTTKQNRAFHALVGEYWHSGAHSYPAKSYNEFRDYIKRDLGAGFESYIYADGDGIHKVKHLDDIPGDVPHSHKLGKLKSWGNYTRKERINTIDKLIVEMHAAGVQTPKFYEILEGMSKNTL